MVLGLCVLFVSGPRRSGKSHAIQMMVDRVSKTKPHYLRLVEAGSDKQPPRGAAKISTDCNIATARWLEYTPDRIFEILPEALAAIHKKDRYGSVVIEADADPNLRCAYPYDHRIFVMPLPSTIHEVFRDPTRAAEELRRVLDDTAAFASEIFGLFADRSDGEPSEDRPDLSGTHMRGFLYSPLGDELATRIQLRQPYHGLVESDVIIINSTIGIRGSETDECLRRIGQLLTRVRGVCGRKSELFLCDPHDHRDAVTKKLVQALKPICQRGT
jgi:hypothetical protein